VLAGLAHEIRNPLQFIKNFAESIVELCEEMADTLVDADLKPELAGDLEALQTEFGQASAKVVEHAERVEEILAAMQAATDADAQRQWTDLDELVGRAVEAASRQARAARLPVLPEVTVERKEALPPALVDAVSMTGAIANLVLNAFEAAADPAASDAPHVWIHSAANDGGFEISVTDTGPGLQPGAETRIFEPFFTRWPGRGHAGLGLPQARDVVEAHGGALTFARDGAGRTMFTITIPK
jgi:two-component system, NtrC family, sensor kinase